MTKERKFLVGVVAGIAAVLLAVGIVAMQAPAVGAAPAESPMLTVTDTHVVLTPTILSRSPGVTVSTTAAVTLGHKFANDGRTFVYLVNGYTDTITASFPVATLVDGLAVADLDVPVYSGTSRLIGPFPVDTYNQSAADSLNKVYMDYSEVTSITVAAYSLPTR